MQIYSDIERETEEYALPDVEVFQLTAEEAVEMNEELMYEAGKKFPLMHMNSRDREKAIAWAMKEGGEIGGWYYWFCFPGCLPDSSAMGPYASAEEATEAARND